MYPYVITPLYLIVLPSYSTVINTPSFWGTVATPSEKHNAPDSSFSVLTFVLSLHPHHSSKVPGALQSTSASFCTEQQLLQRLLTGYSAENVTVECLSLNGTSMSPHPKLRKYCIKGDKKNVRAGGRGVVKCCLLGKTGLLHSGTLRSCGLLHKIGPLTFHCRGVFLLRPCHSLRI